MALWILPFIPLLACTIPDDRVMMLPSIGFAFLIGAWITRSRTDGTKRLWKVPMVWFVAVQCVVGAAIVHTMRLIELDASAFSQATIAGFGRPLRDGDYAFFLNDMRESQVLFLQLCFEAEAGMSGVRAAFLSDEQDPIVRRVDDYTLRIRSQDEGMFTGFIGAMGTSRDREKREGDVFDADELTGRIVDVTNGVVREVELRFRRPLESEAYRFFWCDASARPRKWPIPEAEN